MKFETQETIKLTFSEQEREYIINGDLLFSEVGLGLVDGAYHDASGFHLECPPKDYVEFTEKLTEEMAYRGTRPEEAILRKLCLRFLDQA